MLIALEYTLAFALGMGTLSMLLCGARLLVGPSTQDRILALDALWVCTLVLVLLVGIRLGNELYFELAMLIALLGFVSTMALAKFLMRGEIIE